MFVFHVEVSNDFLWKKNFCINKRILILINFIKKTKGLDKSSSDVAAEGAILNEMLDIVAKRAALRANDPQHGLNSIESDVSLANSSACCSRDFLLKWLIPIILSVFCMFYLHFAHF